MLEVVGKGIKVSPSQMGFTASNKGMILELTIMSSVVSKTQPCPASGVNVYVVVVVLSKAGLQLPIIPLLEVVGKGAKVSPSQIGFTASNTGITLGLTIISSVVSNAQFCPASGVKVYMVVAVLSSAGLQLPVIPLFEVVGSGTKFSPSQIGLTASNIGVTLGLTIMSSVVSETQPCPASGVKV
ncbi:hypothetical protein [Winogradskyella sp.]|uniref:hypothetical protein n=1 Tax=Winogradskyella sp. TaxID=1883156 RepID=UPI003BA975BF